MIVPFLHGVTAAWSILSHAEMWRKDRHLTCHKETLRHNWPRTEVRARGSLFYSCSHTALWIIGMDTSWKYIFMCLGMGRLVVQTIVIVLTVVHIALSQGHHGGCMSILSMTMPMAMAMTMPVAQWLALYVCVYYIVYILCCINQQDVTYMTVVCGVWYESTQ